MHWEVSRLYPTPKSADPPDTCFFCDRTPAIACEECKVLHCTFHTTVLCQSEICVGLRQFRAAPVAAAVAVVAFAAVTAANATHATPTNANATDDTRPGVWICRKWYALPPQSPKMLTVNWKMTKHFAESRIWKRKKISLRDAS